MKTSFLGLGLALFVPACTTVTQTSPAVDVTLPVRIDVARYTPSDFALLDTHVQENGDVQFLYSDTSFGTTRYGIDMVNCSDALQSAYNTQRTRPEFPRAPVAGREDAATGPVAFGANAETARIACAAEGQTLRFPTQ